MLENKNYTEFSLELLQAEQKKIKKELTIRGFIVGFLLGIIVFSAVRNGFKVIPTLIPSILIFLVARDSQKQKAAMQSIKTELSNRNKA